MMDVKDSGEGGGVRPRPRRGPGREWGLRTWLVVSESGQSRVEEVGKHVIMRRTGLSARDLRVLDPLLSYPYSILGRERAIVINSEHIKAISFRICSITFLLFKLCPHNRCLIIFILFISAKYLAPYFEFFLIIPCNS